MQWFALVRHEDPQTYPSYPKEGYPISIHTDKNWWGSSVDGKNYKVVEVMKTIPPSRMVRPIMDLVQNTLDKSAKDDILDLSELLKHS